MYNLVYIISVALNVLKILLIVRVVMSWLRVGYGHPIANFIFEITEPILAPIRSLMPKNMMLDFSPLIAIILLELLGRALINLLL